MENNSLDILTSEIEVIEIKKQKKEEQKQKDWSLYVNKIEYPEFSSPHGLTIKPLPRPENYLYLFLDKNMFLFINKRINERILGKDSAKKRKKFVTTDDIKKYVGMIIYMGIVRLPEIKMYWNNKRVFSSFSPADKISYNKFTRGGVFLENWKRFSRRGTFEKKLGE